MLVAVVPVPKVNPVAAEVVPLVLKEKPTKPKIKNYFHRIKLNCFNTY